MEHDATLTAIGNKTPTTSAQLLVTTETTEKKVLDFGCGKLRNSNYLKEKGFNVTLHDLPKQLAKVNTKGFSVAHRVPQNAFDIVLCAFVLNVVEEPIRECILGTIRKALVRGGTAYIEVRRTVPAKHKEVYKDGFLVGKNKIKTFQKPFNKQEFLELLKLQGFTVEEIQQKSHTIIIKATIT